MIGVLLFVTVGALFAAAILFSRLRATHHELARTRRRMARLEEVADGVALAEQQRHATAPEVNESADVDEARDSGKFFAVDAARKTDPGLDDDFHPPRLRQVPSRERHETPIGSPNPAGGDSVVAVGSILVHADRAKR